jgi:hypothetical protein
VSAQQMPDTQCPLWQSVSSVHPLPFVSCATQAWALLQVPPFTQSELCVQVVLQVVPPHL